MLATHAWRPTWRSPAHANVTFTFSADLMYPFVLFCFLGSPCTPPTLLSASHNRIANGWHPRKNNPSKQHTRTSVSPLLRIPRARIDQNSAIREVYRPGFDSPIHPFFCFLFGSPRTPPVVVIVEPDRSQEPPSAASGRVLHSIRPLSCLVIHPSAVVQESSVYSAAGVAIF